MEIIYDNHKEEWIECLNNPDSKKIAETWLKDGTLDKWRHKRMLKVIDPLIREDATWVTIGDGRYGTDANYILSNGGKAHATDISDELLKIGSEIGFIKSFSEENAENLSFKDESFDYVLIKEALHHCPRPWIALHEAFRVCKKGVILIEPNDIYANRSFRKELIKKIKWILKLFLRKKIFSSGYNFESVGNFIYSTNQRELEKFLLGMHYTNIAFKKLCDFYINGSEHIDLKSNKFKDKIKIHILKKMIFLQEILNILGFEESSVLCSILFKEKPNSKLVSDLKFFKWKYKKLPKNPYI